MVRTRWLSGWLCFSGRSRSDRQSRGSVVDSRRRDSGSPHHRDSAVYHAGRPHGARKVYVLRELPPPAAFKVLTEQYTTIPGKA